MTTARFRLLAALAIALPLACGAAAAIYLRGGTQPPGLALLGTSAPAEELPVMGQLPQFELTERSGARLTRDTLAGHVWIVDFIFTHCAGPCPAMTAQMKRLDSALSDRPEVRLLTITVDPARDTVQALANFGTMLGAPQDRWLFATGTSSAIYSLSIKGFKLGAGVSTPATGGDPMTPFLHSTKFVLVDQGAAVRGYYDGTDPESLHRLVADARKLATSPAGPAAPVAGALGSQGRR